jgi:phenylalanyl-tRNA synthetase beta chain
VENSVEAEKLAKAARAADKQLVSDVSVFDVFQMGDGKKSIAIAVTLQPREQTLTDKDIEALCAKIVAQVGKATGGSLRA